MPIWRAFFTQRALESKLNKHACYSFIHCYFPYLQFFWVHLQEYKFGQSLRLQTHAVVSWHQASSRKHPLNTFWATREAEHDASYFSQAGKRHGVFFPKLNDSVSGFCLRDEIEVLFNFTFGVSRYALLPTEVWSEQSSYFWLSLGSGFRMAADGVSVSGVSWFQLISTVSKQCYFVIHFWIQHLHKKKTNNDLVVP